MFDNAVEGLRGPDMTGQGFELRAALTVARYYFLICLNIFGSFSKTVVGAEQTMINLSTTMHRPTLSYQHLTKLSLGASGLNSERKINSKHIYIYICIEKIENIKKTT